VIISARRYYNQACLLVSLFVVISLEVQVLLSYMKVYTVREVSQPVNDVKAAIVH